MNLLIFVLINTFILVSIIIVLIIFMKVNQHGNDSFKVNEPTKFTKCEQCGSRVYLSDHECPVCGKKISILSNVEDTSQIARKGFDHIVLEKKNNKEKENKGLIATIISVVIAISVILQFVMIFLD